MLTLLCFSFAVAVPAAAKSDLAVDLGRVLSAEGDAQELLAEIREANPSLEELRATLERGVAPVPSTERAARLQAGWGAWKATDAEGVVRPYQLYVPASVAGGEPMTALVIHLHGSVARAEFGTGLGSPNASGYASLLWPEIAEAEGIVLATPLGRADCVWWSDAGVRHIRAVVRDVRRSLRVPDRSIFASGFSDGASGCYYLAMAAPDPFAGFIAMNGHPAVAASASGKQLYLRNLGASEMLAVCTQEDTLYPSRTVFPHLEKAIRSGANVHFLSYPEMNHQPLYFEEQTALITNFIRRRKRAEDREESLWLTSTPELGRARGVRILELGESGSDGSRIEPYNVMSEQGRVRLGVQTEPEGNLLVDVVEDSAAARAGMKVGDRIVQLEGQAVAGGRDLRRVLRSKTYGESFEARVEREGQTLTLTGQFAAHVPEPIYLRDEPTAHVRAVKKVNESGELSIEVDCRFVRSLEVDLPPEAAGAAVVRGRINGEDRELAVHVRSVEELLVQFSESGDASALRSHYVKIRLD